MIQIQVGIGWFFVVPGICYMLFGWEGAAISLFFMLFFVLVLPVLIYMFKEKKK